MFGIRLSMLFVLQSSICIISLSFKEFQIEFTIEHITSLDVDIAYMKINNQIKEMIWFLAVVSTELYKSDNRFEVIKSRI